MGIKAKKNDGPTHLGERLPTGKDGGSEVKALREEIDKNKYEQVEIEVIDDPKFWPESLHVSFSEGRDKMHTDFVAKNVRIIKHTYKWLTESETGGLITSVVKIRTSIGMTKKTWDAMVEDSEEFAYYSDLIYDIIGSRLHDSGIHSAGNQVFKIFSMKNHLPDEFADKKEVKRSDRIEVVKITEGSAEDIKAAIEEGKKRLNK